MIKKNIVIASLFLYCSSVLASGFYLPPRPPKKVIKQECTGDNCNKEKTDEISKEVNENNTQKLKGDNNEVKSPKK